MVRIHLRAGAAKVIAMAAALQMFALPTLTAAEAAPEASAARQAFQRGAFDQAAAFWERSAADNHRAGRKAAESSDLLNLAASYQALGQHPRALEILERATSLAEQSGERALTLQAKGQLAGELAMLRQTEKAESLLRSTVETAEADKLTPLLPQLLNELGTVLTSESKFDDGLAALERAGNLARESGQKDTIARAQVNAAVSACRAGLPEKAEALNGQALQDISNLQEGHDKAFLLLTAAQTDAQLAAAAPLAGKNLLLVRSQDAARRALALAEDTQDRAMLTYALGQLAELYEQDGQLDHALSLGRRAAFEAQRAQLPDALYRWEWAMGRVFRAQGKSNEAIASYRRAVQTLQPIRHDIALGYGNVVNRSFRESLGPLFYQLADLLLLQSQAEKDPDRLQKLLADARDTMEQLKAVELEDYFKDECCDVVRAKSAALENVDRHSAVLYVIPLPDRTELLVSLNSGIQRFATKIGAAQLNRTVREFRRNLETRTTYEYLEQSQQLYDWIVRPIHHVLQQNEIETVVFVPDGALQTIPLASLNDGNRFLVEEFAVTITPGLSVVEPRPIERKKAEVLLSGLSDPVQGFPSLEFVPDELQTIESEYRSEKLLNADFRTAAIEQKLEQEQFSIVHIASHGQFDRDAQKTFVLTYDGKITLNKLEALIRPSQYRGKPVELLVLSACQTAAGDDRAALGLAGVAVKAGARSALASLWFVNDQSTAAFVSELYNQLRQPGSISRAKAVQAAQIKMLADRRFRHPCYWAPYLLIGNWL